MVLHESFRLSHPQNERNEVPTADICWQDIWACVEFKMESDAPLKEIFQTLEERYEDGVRHGFSKASDNPFYPTF